MDIDVSVAIVNYNDYARTREAIRSVLECTRDIKIKIYVIDNASSDRSAEQIAGEFSSVSMVLSDRNLGYGAANNIVLKDLESKYHAIVNPDIILRDNVLKALFDYMQASPDVGMCIPAVYFPDGRPQRLPRKDPKLKYLIANRLPGAKMEAYRAEYTMSAKPHEGPTDIEFVSGCFMFARTSLLKEARGFDERYFMYFEDADLSRTIRKRARLVLLPDISVYHDYKRLSAKKIRYFAIHFTSMVKYFIKWNRYDKLQGQGGD